MSEADEKSLLVGLEENLQLVIDQLRDDSFQRQPPDEFDLPKFWTRINAAVKAVSTSSTKLCMAFNEPPFPSLEEGSPLVQRLQESILALISAFYSLPKAQGLSLQRKVRASVLSIVEGALALVSAIAAQNSSKSKDHLHSTGCVWQSCDAFPSLPKDNKDATLLDVQQTLDLVKDALEEIEQAQQNEGESLVDDLSALGLDHADDFFPEQPNQAWTPKDKELLPPCIGLIKASKASLKKISSAIKNSGKCSCGESISQLDDVGQKAQSVSAHVDELVAALYPPVSTQMLSQNVDRLCIQLLSLLDYTKLSHLTSDADDSWMEFLRKAISHNQTKVQQLLAVDMPQDPPLSAE